MSLYLPTYDETYEVALGRGQGSLAPEQHEGLVGAWLLNEGGGSVSRDLSGHGIDATHSGTGGRWANSLRRVVGDFNGTDDVFTIANAGGNAPAHLQVANRFTFCFWVDVDNFGTYAAILMQQNWNTAGNFGSMIRSNGGTRVYINGNFRLEAATYADKTAMVAAGWFHIACVFDDVSDSVRIYHNGKELNSDTYAATFTAATGSLQLGDTNPAGFPFEGRLTDARIYNRVLPPGTIADIYNRPWDAWTLRPRVPRVKAAAAPVSGDGNDLLLLGVG